MSRALPFTIPTTPLPSGESLPVLGQGTWRMGEDSRARNGEVAALRHGLDLGLTLIDTAEMYGEGGAEMVVGEAIAGRRDEVFLVSKVYPHNAGRQSAIAACERSLRRLKTDRLDLYLLHWRGEIPLAETIEAFERLVRTGKIRYWGVSNFDMSDMQELTALPAGDAVAVNQILYNPLHRGPEWALLPWCRERRIPVMAYSPIEMGRIVNHPALCALAKRVDATPAQLILAWLLRQPGIVSIPKAVQWAHIEENLRALNLSLDEEILTCLEALFPPPNEATPLESS